MSLFSRDLLVNYIRYLQCLNLVNNYLHEYSIYTAPGFSMVEYQYLLKLINHVLYTYIRTLLTIIIETVLHILIHTPSALHM